MEGGECGVGTILIFLPNNYISSGCRICDRQVGIICPKMSFVPKKARLLWSIGEGARTQQLPA